MEAEIRERTDVYINAGITTRLGNSWLHNALRALAETPADHANAGEFEIGDEDFRQRADPPLPPGQSPPNAQISRNFRV
jgi:hypothetical protein